MSIHSFSKLVFLLERRDALGDETCDEMYCKGRCFSKNRPHCRPFWLSQPERTFRTRAIPHFKALSVYKMNRKKNLRKSHFFSVHNVKKSEISHNVGQIFSHFGLFFQLTSCIFFIATHHSFQQKNKFEKRCSIVAVTHQTVAPKNEKSHNFDEKFHCRIIEFDNDKKWFKEAYKFLPDRWQAVVDADGYVPSSVKDVP